MTSTKGVLIVETIVNDYWESDWESISQANDDGIDGIIHIRRKGELTGEVIYVQVKSGDSYRSDTAKRPNHFGVNVTRAYIESHMPGWNKLNGAVILIFVGNDRKAFWTDLKSVKSYDQQNKNVILIPKTQVFGAHSKGHFRKIGGFIPQDRNLIKIRLAKEDLEYLRIDTPLNVSVRKFYKEWATSSTDLRMNPGLGEIIVNRVGWRHISRTSRGFNNVFQSWQLLGAAKKIIQEVDKAYQINKIEAVKEETDEYTLKDFISLRAEIIFPNRQKGIIQVVLRRKKVVSRTTKESVQKVWFYSVYEPRKA